MEVTYEFNMNPKTKQGLKNIPSDILYSIAKQTLDISYPIIPMSDITGHRGTLRRSSISGGVRGADNDYYIGSYTSYASHVWSLNDQTTNWTTRGTHSQWFARTLKEKGHGIIQVAINQAWKENM